MKIILQKIKKLDFVLLMLLAVVLFACISFVGFTQPESQKQTLRAEGATVSTTAELETALSNASYGDTIYISTSFTLTKTVNISKDINILAQSSNVTISSTNSYSIQVLPAVNVVFGSEDYSVNFSTSASSGLIIQQNSNVTFVNSSLLATATLSHNSTLTLDGSNATKNINLGEEGYLWIQDTHTNKASSVSGVITALSSSPQIIIDADCGKLLVNVGDNVAADKIVAITTSSSNNASVELRDESGNELTEGYNVVLDGNNYVTTQTLLTLNANGGKFTGTSYSVLYGKQISNGENFGYTNLIDPTISADNGGNAIKQTRSVSSDGFYQFTGLSNTSANNAYETSMFTPYKEDLYPSGKTFTIVVEVKNFSISGTSSITLDLASGSNLQGDGTVQFVASGSSQMIHKILSITGNGTYTTTAKGVDISGEDAKFFMRNHLTIAPGTTSATLSIRISVYATADNSDLVYYTNEARTNQATGFYIAPNEFLPNVTNGDYIFDGWYTETSGGIKITALDEFSASDFNYTTLYARWRYAVYADIYINQDALIPVNSYALEFTNPDNSTVYKNGGVGIIELTNITTKSGSFTVTIANKANEHGVVYGDGVTSFTINVTHIDSSLGTVSVSQNNVTVDSQLVGKNVTVSGVKGRVKITADIVWKETSLTINMNGGSGTDIADYVYYQSEKYCGSSNASTKTIYYEYGDSMFDYHKNFFNYNNYETSYDNDLFNTSVIPNANTGVFSYNTSGRYPTLFMAYDPNFKNTTSSDIFTMFIEVSNFSAGGDIKYFPTLNNVVTYSGVSYEIHSQFASTSAITINGNGLYMITLKYNGNTDTEYTNIQTDESNKMGQFGEKMLYFMRGNFENPYNTAFKADIRISIYEGSGFNYHEKGADKEEALALFQSKNYTPYTDSSNAKIVAQRYGYNLSSITYSGNNSLTSFEALLDANLKAIGVSTVTLNWAQANFYVSSSLGAIGEGYDRMFDAITAAKDGDYIDLVGADSDTTLVINKSLTIVTRTGKKWPMDRYGIGTSSSTNEIIVNWGVPSGTENPYNFVGPDVTSTADGVIALYGTNTRLIWNSGTLTSNPTSNSTSSYPYAICLFGNSNFTLNGGLIKLEPYNDTTKTDYAGTWIWAIQAPSSSVNPTVVINGGEVICTTSRIYTSGGVACSVYMYRGDITVNGGKLIASATSNRGYNIVLAPTATRDCSAHIAGGTFIGNVPIYYDIAGATLPTISYGKIYLSGSPTFIHTTTYDVLLYLTTTQANTLINLNASFNPTVLTAEQISAMGIDNTVYKNTGFTIYGVIPAENASLVNYIMKHNGYSYTNVSYAGDIVNYNVVKSGNYIVAQAIISINLYSGTGIFSDGTYQKTTDVEDPLDNEFLPSSYAQQFEGYFVNRYSLNASAGNTFRFNFRPYLSADQLNTSSGLKFAVFLETNYDQSRIDINLDGVTSIDFNDLNLDNDADQFNASYDTGSYVNSLGVKKYYIQIVVEPTGEKCFANTPIRNYNYSDLCFIDVQFGNPSNFVTTEYNNSGNISAVAKAGLVVFDGSLDQLDWYTFTLNEDGYYAIYGEADYAIWASNEKYGNAGVGYSGFNALESTTSYKYYEILKSNELTAGAQRTFNNAEGALIFTRYSNIYVTLHDYNLIITPTVSLTVGGEGYQPIIFRTGTITTNDDGTKTCTGTGCVRFNTGIVTLNNIKVYTGGTYALWISNATSATLNNVLVYGTITTGSPLTLYLQNCTEVVMENCNITGSYNTSFFTVCPDVQITNCNFNGGRYAVETSNSTLKISGGSLISNTSGWGYSARVSNSNVEFDGVEMSSLNYGCYLQGVSSVSITDCTITAKNSIYIPATTGKVELTLSGVTTTDATGTTGYYSLYFVEGETDYGSTLTVTGVNSFGNYSGINLEGIAATFNNTTTNISAVAGLTLSSTTTILNNSTLNIDANVGVSMQGLGSATINAQTASTINCSNALYGVKCEGDSTISGALTINLNSGKSSSSAVAVLIASACAATLNGVTVINNVTPSGNYGSYALQVEGYGTVTNSIILNKGLSNGTAFDYRSLNVTAAVYLTSTVGASFSATNSTFGATKTGRTYGILNSTPLSGGQYVAVSGCTIYGSCGVMNFSNNSPNGAPYIEISGGYIYATSAYPDWDNWGQGCAVFNRGLGGNCPAKMIIKNNTYLGYTDSSTKSTTTSYGIFNKYNYNVNVNGCKIYGANAGIYNNGSHREAEGAVNLSDVLTSSNYSSYNNVDYLGIYLLNCNVSGGTYAVHNQLYIDTANSVDFSNDIYICGGNYSSSGNTVIYNGPESVLENSQERNFVTIVGVTATQASGANGYVIYNANKYNKLYLKNNVNFTGKIYFSGFVTGETPIEGTGLRLNATIYLDVADSLLTVGQKLVYAPSGVGDLLVYGPGAVSTGDPAFAIDSEEYMLKYTTYYIQVSGGEGKITITSTYDDCDPNVRTFVTIKRVTASGKIKVYSYMLTPGKTYVIANLMNATYSVSVTSMTNHTAVASSNSIVIEYSASNTSSYLKSLNIEVYKSGYGSFYGASSTTVSQQAQAEEVAESVLQTVNYLVETENIPATNKTEYKSQIKTTNKTNSNKVLSNVQINNSNNFFTTTKENMFDFNKFALNLIDKLNEYYVSFAKQKRTVI